MNILISKYVFLVLGHRGDSWLSWLDSCRDEYTENKNFYRTACDLKEVPEDIPQNAVKIDLSNNDLMTIPVNAFAKNQDCLYLSLHRNSIWGIDSGAFSGLTKLRELDLSRNQISGWTPDMFQGPLHSLRSLHIIWNGFHSIDDGVFSKLEGLTHLDLSCTIRRKLNQDMFRGLVNLKTLVLVSFVVPGSDSIEPQRIHEFEQFKVTGPRGK